MSALPVRACGDCNACCIELKIDTPEFRKKERMACQHLTAQGCGIYDSRYPACRTFLCGWRLMPELDEGWRPDLSGILAIQKGPADLPPAYRAPGYGVEFVVLGGKAAVTRPGFAAAVARMLAQGIAVQLSARSPYTLLNEHLDPVHAGRDLPGLTARLLELYRLLDAGRWSRGRLAQIIPLYRLQLDRAKNTHKTAS